MNAQETELITKLLRRSRPVPLPLTWKHQILSSARAVKESGKKPLLPTLGWGAVLACWAVILFLHVTKPTLSRVIVPFDAVAYQARATLLEQVAAMDGFPCYLGPLGRDSQEVKGVPTGVPAQTPPPQNDSPDQDPLHMELRMQLHPPHSSQAAPTSPAA